MRTLVFLSALALAGPAHGAAGIRETHGRVQVFLPALGRWRPVLDVPYGLRPGDRVRLAPSARATLALDDGSELVASREAVLLVERDDDEATALRLESGRVEARVRRDRDRLIEIRTARGAVTLRADRASVDVDARGNAAVEVEGGLADVAPSVGSRVQVPGGYRLELAPGKAPGLPIAQREFRQLQRWEPAPAGANRKQPRVRASADPEPDASLRPSAPPPLGPASLGLPAQPKRPEPPALGTESLGIEPSLGPESLGLGGVGKKESPPPALGPESLGLKAPPSGPAKKKASAH